MQQQQNQQETASLAAVPAIVDPNVENFMEMVKTLEKDLDLSPTLTTTTVIEESAVKENNDQTASGRDLQKKKEPYKNDNLNLKKRKRQRSEATKKQKKQRLKKQQQQQQQQQTMIKMFPIHQLKHLQVLRNTHENNRKESKH